VLEPTNKKTYEEERRKQENSPIAAKTLAFILQGSRPPHFRCASTSSAARLTQRRSTNRPEAARIDSEPHGGGSGLCGDADLLAR